LEAETEGMETTEMAVVVTIEAVAVTIEAVATGMAKTAAVTETMMMAMTQTAAAVTAGMVVE
jgi:hypothetical protein